VHGLRKLQRFLRIAVSESCAASFLHDGVDNVAIAFSMKTHAIQPTGVAQTFAANETFFSTTDERGVITAGNGVFSRTSGYALDELVGQPHNIIRHSEMPRVVFRQLWETIRAGRSFMGYVKNQARNGSHYWVFAVIVPIPQGFLSVRIKPTSPILSQIEAIYQRLAAKEAEAISAGRSEGQAADASREQLERELKELGFTGYEAFSHHALNREITCRDAEISHRRLRLFPVQLAPAGKDEAQPLLAALYAQTLLAYADINVLFASLDSFVAVSRGIRERKDSVQAIAEDFRLNALNAQIAAQPLGEQGRTLGTVAEILNHHGLSLSRNVSGLAECINHTATAVADIASNLSAARIQIEMLLSYVAEIALDRAGRAENHQIRSIMEDLGAGFVTTMERAFHAIETLQRRLPEVLGTKELLRKDIVFLHVAQISGLTEVSRLRDASTLRTTFTGLRAQIDTGSRELERLDEVVDELKALTANTPHHAQNIQRSMQQMRESLTLAKSRMQSGRGAPLTTAPATVRPVRQEALNSRLEKPEASALVSCA
jgi:PAS domain S-box-containing protein